MQLAVTCVELSRDEGSAFSASKDNALHRWDVATGKRVAVLSPSWKGASCGYKAHEKEVLAMAASSDGRYLAAGGRDQEIRIYDCRTNACVKTFTGHRDAVTALVFRTDSHALYSGSLDRCLKHWNCDELAYVETTFGHQAGLHGIDAWRKEKAVTCGEDRTCRVWKLTEDSHLMFKGHSASIDAVGLLSEESWVSGGQDGAVALWQASKKKPVKVAIKTPLSSHGRFHVSYQSQLAGCALAGTCSEVGAALALSPLGLAPPPLPPLLC